MGWTERIEKEAAKELRKGPLNTRNKLEESQQVGTHMDKGLVST